MNSYLVNFPSPDNTSFSTGGMIDIALGMIPKDKMIESKVEPRNLIFKELIDHCESLENQEGLNANEPRSKRKNHKSGSGSKNNHNREKQICDLCKVFKGENFNAWKTHSTADYKSRKYYASKVNISDNKSKNNYHCNKKQKFNKNMRASISAQVNTGIKKALKKYESGVTDSSSDSE